MKIIKSVRDIHAQAFVKYQRLEHEVRSTLKPQVEEKGWFFLCRVKALESFALKIETGRVINPNAMEDFLGCTIVVPTAQAIEDAETLLDGLYDLDERRPPDDRNTRKQSFSFPFDDLRLYVKRRSSVSGKDEDLNGLKFEVQIKTILQHAWSIATHDLIYKTNSVSWPKERIAFQVKAMLEHAEIAILQAERLADARTIARSDDKTNSILSIIEQIQHFWSADRLPNDIKRLSEVFYELLRATDLNASELAPKLEAEKRRIGFLPTDLSPYAFFVQALAQSGEIDFKKKFSRNHIKLRIVIHDGMDLPDWLKQPHDRILILDAKSSS